MSKIVVKMGLTPSNAPFRMANLRTFMYIYSFLMNGVYKGNECEMIFQLDDTDPKKRLHTDEQIIEFYRKLGILNDELPYVIRRQTANEELCNEYYQKLEEKKFVTVDDERVKFFRYK